MLGKTPGLKKPDYQKDFLKLKHLRFEIKKIHADRNGVKLNYIHPDF